jgi:hypothetical protein
MNVFLDLVWIYPGTCWENPERYGPAGSGKMYRVTYIRIYSCVLLGHLQEHAGRIPKPLQDQDIVSCSCPVRLSLTIHMDNMYRKNKQAKSVKIVVEPNNQTICRK